MFSEDALVMFSEDGMTINLAISQNYAVRFSRCFHCCGRHGISPYLSGGAGDSAGLNQATAFEGLSASAPSTAKRRRSSSERCGLRWRQGRLGVAAPQPDARDGQ